MRSHLYDAVSLAKRSRRDRADEKNVSRIRRDLPFENRNSIVISEISEIQLERSVVGNSVFTIWIESVSDSPTIEGAALIQIECFTSDGDQIRLSNWPDRSRRVGDFQYLIPGDVKNPRVTEISFDVPETATRVRITGHQWKVAAKTWVVGHVVSSSDDDLVHNALDSGTPFEIPYQNYTFTEVVPEDVDEVEVSLNLAIGNGKKVPFRVRFLDCDGNPLLPPSDLRQHPKFGAFFDAKTSSDRPALTKMMIAVVPGAKFMTFAPFEGWNLSARIVGPPIIEWVRNSTIDSIIDDVIRAGSSTDALILIDSTAPPLGHETLSIRPNNLAKEFGALGHKVIYFSFGSLQEHPNRISDRIVQFARSEFDYVVKRLLKLDYAGPKIYYCTSFTDFSSLYTQDRLKRGGWKVIYEVRDNMEEFRRVGYSKWYEPEFEARFARRADQIITVSPALAKKVQVLGQLETMPTVIPNGVRPEIVDRFADLRTADSLNKRSHARLVGYVGHLTPSWFDWPTLISVAKLTPDVNFELVGHGAPSGISVPENVTILGPKNHDELAEIATQWKIGIIPFIDSPLTRGVDPNKIYEYFAWGNRVIGSKMGSIDSYPATMVYNSVDEFAHQIHLQLEAEWTEEELQRVNELLEVSRWDSRATQVLTSIGIKIGTEN